MRKSAGERKALKNQFQQKKIIQNYGEKNVYFWKTLRVCFGKTSEALPILPETDVK